MSEGFGTIASCGSTVPTGKLLLVALLLEIQALTGWTLPEAALPGLTLVAQVDVEIASGTGGHSAGQVKDAVYVPQWNVIFAEKRLLKDSQEFQAILVHELVHFWQATRGPKPQFSEAEARRVENLWRARHGMKRR